MGGLGNQMFQYAAARRVSHVRNVPLKLDLGWFGSSAAVDTARRYQLGVFSIRGEFATPEEIRKLTGRLTNSIAKRLRRTIERSRPVGRRSWIMERGLQFDPDIFDIAGNVYLDGYWQSERYFADIQEIIRREFTLQVDPDPLTSGLCKRAHEVESVSVHIRRGDYVWNPVTRHFHGTCPPDYYRSAARYIADMVKDVHFFVFSDDPAWVRENLTLESPATFVTHNGPDKGHDDLRIMTHCKHHIIANSSFSWWGAWLGRHPGKIVVAPRKWFADDTIHTGDPIPEGWVRL